jgi:hypothetical protein
MLQLSLLLLLLLVMLLLLLLLLLQLGWAIPPSKSTCRSVRKPSEIGSAF